MYMRMLLAHVQDAVAVVGYPIGGETISVTTGVVSRIEVTSYSHGATELLGIQIDAAINPGNSGGCLCPFCLAASSYCRHRSRLYITDEHAMAPMCQDRRLCF